MYVDSHCHLSFPELAARVDEIRLAMATAQVDRALCICTTLEEFPQVHALAKRYDNFWASAGVHPDSEGVQEPTLEDLVSELSGEDHRFPTAALAYFRVSIKHWKDLSRESEAELVDLWRPKDLWGKDES